MTLKGSCPVREGGVGVVGIPTPGLLPHPKEEGCNSLTQTDGKMCRWLTDHRTGDPVRGRAGEGEQVAR